jgi:hypothetical protein
MTKVNMAFTKSFCLLEHPIVHITEDASSVGDPNTDVLGLPDPNPLVRGMDLYPAPDTSLFS